MNEITAFHLTIKVLNTNKHINKDSKLRQKTTALLNDTPFWADHSTKMGIKIPLNHFDWVVLFFNYNIFDFFKIRRLKFTL